MNDALRLRANACTAATTYGHPCQPAMHTSLCDLFLQIMEERHATMELARNLEVRRTALLGQMVLATGAVTRAALSSRVDELDRFRQALPACRAMAPEEPTPALVPRRDDRRGVYLLVRPGKPERIKDS